MQQERLAAELQGVADAPDLASKVGMQDAAIQGARVRILALRAQVLQAEQQIGRLLDTVVAGSDR